MSREWIVDWLIILGVAGACFVLAYGGALVVHDFVVRVNK